jgi:CBS domain-containing protein
MVTTTVRPHTDCQSEARHHRVMTSDFLYIGSVEVHSAAAELGATKPALISSIDTITRSRLLRVGIDASLAKVAALLTSAQIGLVVVCDATGAMVGTITETILVRQLGFGKADIFTTQAGEVMARDYTVCAPSDSLAEVLTVMHHRELIHVPVMGKDNIPMGVFNARDGLRALLTSGSYEESLLRNYVMGVGYH